MVKPPIVWGNLSFRKEGVLTEKKVLYLIGIVIATGLQSVRSVYKVKNVFTTLNLLSVKLKKI